MTPEERRRAEEEQQRREVARLADAARVQAPDRGGDAYVARRVDQEMAAIAEAERQAREAELSESGGARPSSLWALLLLGLAISAGVLALIHALGSGR